MAKERPGDDTAEKVESGDASGTTEALEAKVKKMEAEIAALKKQMNQLVTIVKQKLK